MRIITPDSYGLYALALMSPANTGSGGKVLNPAGAELKKPDQAPSGGGTFLEGGAGNDAPEAMTNDRKVLIVSALAGLNNDANKDWDDTGRPSLKRVQAIAKDDTITQEELESVAVDENGKALKRKVAKNAQVVVVQDDENDDAKKVVVSAYVVALEAGYAAGAYRDPGEFFVYTGPLGRWMREATDKEKKQLQKQREADDEE